MIFNLLDKRIERVTGLKLNDIGWKEKDLQTLIFNNIEKMFDDQNLLLIMQSRA